MKQVTFDLDRNSVVETFSSDDYDRRMIDSILVRKCRNQVSFYEWFSVVQELQKYKSQEMIVHPMSLQNTSIQ
jgi:predicted GTPase